jgi:alpha-beta hydrolase superfamily lysophospholipase
MPYLGSLSLALSNTVSCQSLPSAAANAIPAHAANSAMFSVEGMCPGKADPNAKISKMNEHQLKDYANAAFWNDQYCEAQQAVEELLKRANCTEKKKNHECFELGMNYAILDLQRGNLKDAKSRLAKLFPLVKNTKTNDGMDDPDCQFFIAECEYREGKYSDAINSYKRALSLYRDVLPEQSPDLAPALEGLAGCYYRKRNFAAVEPIYKELARIDLITRGSDDLRFAWSLMNLADIAHKLGREDDRRLLFETSVYIFREVNERRIMAELKQKETEVAEKGEQKEKAKDAAIDNDKESPDRLLEKTVRTSIFGKVNLDVVADAKRKSLELLKFDRTAENVKRVESEMATANDQAIVKRPFDFYNWRFKRSQKVDAPGFVIVDPSVPLRGIIICAHGLGLHHKSYEDFGTRMSKLGYAIVSFDMRGFGGYKDEKGYDLVDLAGCVEDLGNIITLFKRDYPTTPLFLLGESMGGAIALHVAVKYQNDLQGLVSSVPSGSRYKSKRTALKVAYKLLSGKNHQFDIGSRVVDQATHDENLRKEWKDDPSARMDLSASELITFQRFMNQNVHLAKELKTLPVIIFQGFGDKLVRPEGTLALYNALGTRYKNLELIGHQEHLIFEEGQCPPEVIDGLFGWLNNHRTKKATVAIGTNNQ